MVVGQSVGTTFPSSVLWRPPHMAGPPRVSPARDGTYLIEGACSHTEVAPYLEQYVKPEAARWHTLDDIAKTLDGCIAKLAEADQTVNTKYFRELVM